MGWTARVRLQTGAREFSLHSIQTRSEAHTIQRVPRILPWGYSGQGVKRSTHLHLVPRSRMVELHLHSPIRFHGVVLN
jgi:hypothetical protein